MGMWHTRVSVCVCLCVSACAKVHVGMHMDTSWVNVLHFGLLETLKITPQYILPPSLSPLIFKPQAALRGKFNPYMSTSFSFKSSKKLF